jgi:hypothetical protein
MQFVVQYDSITNGNSLLYDYKTIEGKNAQDALQKAYGLKFKRLFGEEGSRADVIITKGRYENNTIYYSGRYMLLCYGKIE